MQNNMLAFVPGLLGGSVPLGPAGNPSESVTCVSKKIELNADDEPTVQARIDDEKPAKMLLLDLLKAAGALECIFADRRSGPHADITLCQQLAKLLHRAGIIEHMDDKSAPQRALVYLSSPCWETVGLSLSLPTAWCRTSGRSTSCAPRPPCAPTRA